MDRLIFNRKTVCEDHFCRSVFQKQDMEHSLLINSCTDINFKPRTESHPGQFHTVKVKRAQLSLKTIDTIQYNNIICKALIITSSSFSEHDMLLTC